MNNEMLSQDQIDALSSGADLSDIGTGESSGGKGLDTAQLSKALRLLADQATTVLSTVVGREVRARLDSCTPASANAIKTEYAKDYLLLTVQFNKGFSGSLYYCISKKDTAILADLMMMGDGAAEYEEDHKDAIGELVNQIMGATGTSFGVQFNMECGATPPVVADFDPSSTNIVLAECTAARIGLNVQGLAESGILLLIPNDLGGAIAQKAALATQEEAAPASAAEAGATEAAPAAEKGGELMGAQFGAFESGAGSRPQAAPALAGAPGNINMLLDIQLQVSIELGRTEMSIKRILELGPGSIIELDRMAGEPVDLLVNGKVVAKGEVVVVDENFGIRIVSLVSPEERLKSLK